MILFGTTQNMIARISISVIIALALAHHTAALEQIDVGVATKSEETVVQAGVFVLQSDVQPALLFGIWDGPDGDPYPPYIVLIRHRAHEKSRIQTPAAVRASTQGKNHIFTMADGVAIDDRRFELMVRFTRHFPTRVYAVEFEVNGKPIDLMSGSIFLVDLRGEKTTWQQIEEFPPDVPVPPICDKNQVHEVAGRIITELSESSEQVRRFLAQP